MSAKNPRVTQILTLLILLGGAFLRVYHLFKVDFIRAPFRLGGLFVAFAQQIIQNGFRLPVTIPYYSEGGIPFAYPPLGFYLEAFLLKIFPAWQFVIANLLPPLIAVLALLLAYLVLRQIFPAQPGYLLAALFAYAFLGNAFSNQVEAAGLAESTGSVALLVYFLAVFRYRNQPGRKNAALAGLALGLCILSSPGSAVGAALLSVLLAAATLVMRKGSASAWIESGIAALAGLLVSAPYWFTVMLNHGRGIFFLPVLAQYQPGGNTTYLAKLFDQLTSFSVTDRTGTFFWNALIFLGLLWLLLHSKPAIPLAFLALISIPREGVWMIAFPAALLFAYGLMDVLVPLARPLLDLSWSPRKYVWTAIAAALVLWLVAQSFALIDGLIADQQWKVTAPQVVGTEQAAAFIPAGARVLVIGNDGILEWAPYLLQREVINTKYGLEWKPAQLQKVTALNDEIRTALTWDDVLSAVSQMDGQTQVYVFSTEKNRLSELVKGSHASYTPKFETPDVQVGILGNP